MRRMHTDAEIEKIAESAAPELTPDALSEVLEGSETVTVDENEAGTKLTVKLDETYKEGLEDAIAEKQNQLEDSDEIVVDNENNKLFLDQTVSNKIAKALVTPVSTPTERLIPTVTTGNAQENIGIGDGLTVEGGKLKASGGTLYRHRITLALPIIVPTITFTAVTFDILSYKSSQLTETEIRGKLLNVLTLGFGSDREHTPTIFELRVEGLTSQLKIYATFLSSTGIEQGSENFSIVTFGYDIEALT